MEILVTAFMNGVVAKGKAKMLTVRDSDSSKRLNELYSRHHTDSYV